MDSIYLEIVEPERIVFRDAPPDAGGTRCIPRSSRPSASPRRTAARASPRSVRFASHDARDKAVEMGFARPVVQSLERLEALLAAR